MCNQFPNDGQLSDCDKALPETAFGRTLTNQNTRGLLFENLGQMQRLYCT